MQSYMWFGNRTETKLLLKAKHGDFGSKKTRIIHKNQALDMFELNIVVYQN